MSFKTQVDYIGWVVSGLYTIDQIRNFLVFAVLILAALILNIAASFTEVTKKPDTAETGTI